jgi:hypothetical protein
MSVRSTRISARRTPSGSREPGRWVVDFFGLLGFRVHGFSALSLASSVFEFSIQSVGRRAAAFVLAGRGLEGVGRGGRRRRREGGSSPVISGWSARRRWSVTLVCWRCASHRGPRAGEELDGAPRRARRQQAPTLGEVVFAGAGGAQGILPSPCCPSSVQFFVCSI